MPGKTALKILEIEKEFNNDFESVIKTFAEAGHSITDTSELLGIGRHAFGDLVTHMNWKTLFPTGRQSIKNQMATRGLTPAKEAALQKSRAKRFEQHAFEYKGIRDTATGFARRYNTTARAIRYRHKKGLPLEHPPK